MKKEGGLAFLTAEEMAEADRVSIEEFGVDVLSLMENAGMQTARLARKMLGGSVEKRRVCCLVGKGNNGGDGLVAARHLRNWGADVSVVVGGEKAELKEIPARQLRVVESMGLPVTGPGSGFERVDLILDALLGYGSRGDPREPVAGLIRGANGSEVPILAVDLPSGLDANTGKPGSPCIVASSTVTFGLPKVGFLSREARGYLGELYLADISMPRPVYERFSQAGWAFGSDTLVKVW